MIRLFIFGTLKCGFPNSAINQGHNIKGRFKTRQAYPLLLVGDRHSPWLVDEPGSGYQVTGEIFKVDKATLRAMDKLERIDQPDGYRRTKIAVENSYTGETLLVDAYLKPPDQLNKHEVMGGPYREYTLDHASQYQSRN
ncbi:MAG: gamma-glutamylaminecyclotransferase [Gammaproteobacteria bacterium]|jgi:gamma-glutamylaminecyclotransferase